MIARIGVVLMWVSAGVAVLLANPVGGLVIGLAALPATAAALLAARRCAAGVLVVTLCASSWASASGVVPQTFPWDDIEHALLAFGCCWLVGDLLYPVLTSRGLVIATAVAVTMICAVIWEVVEWATDQMLGTNLSPGSTDTITDLFAGLVGAVAGVTILRWGSSRSPARRSAARRLEADRDERLVDRGAISLIELREPDIRSAGGCARDPHR